MTTPTRLQPRQTTPKRAGKMPSNEGLNVNDLLNFTLPPRQHQPPQSLPRRSRKTVNQGVWNKERFVNAQYRFVMNPTGDYTVHFADPDIFFQWQDILQVIIPRTSALASAAAGGENRAQDEGYTSCPICLAPPTAPRMTKCGHVFCFPCILHYLSTSDNKWARCPICFDSVNERQLKSVKWFDGPPVSDEDTGESREASSSSSVMEQHFTATPREGAILRLRLMQRPQITTLALPRSHTWPSDLLPPHQAPFHFLPDVYNYAKFMLATPDYLIENLTRDLDELAAERRTLRSLNDELGILFVDGAEDKLRLQMAKAAALDTPQLKTSIDKAMQDQAEIEQRATSQARRAKHEPTSPPSVSEIPQEFLAAKSGGFVSSMSPTAVPFEPKQPISPSSNRPMQRQRRNINPPPPSTSTYYFYQATSGLPIFLHPLDIRILFAHFHRYASFPDTISVRVESVTEGTVNDDLRKRCKYLGHIPEGADVVFIEADLEGVVGAEGLRAFEGPLRMRRTRRKEKGRKDERARARAEEREREREREFERDRSWTTAHAAPPLLGADSLLADVLAMSEREASPSPVPPAPDLEQQQVSGAWGARSFASALHSAPSQAPRAGSNTRGPRRDTAEDEYDLDVAWHELERSSGGRKKRGNKLVVLGGGGGRRR
ncbi:hypothetical protein HGRIS_008356 [Hohenbuehelia grisea]|uniref:RING-type domain-containing protein n=1 Tax=Hohenbuehelia grisea TaxID=104357 RepID=A0ABR3J851_9AGAR